MSIKVIVPTPLRSLTGGSGAVEAEGRTLEEVLNDLESRYPGFKARICDETGQIRRFINVFVDKEDIRFLEGLETKVSDGAEISILPAIAGGGVLLNKSPSS